MIISGMNKLPDLPVEQIKPDEIKGKKIKRSKQ